MAVTYQEGRINFADDNDATDTGKWVVKGWLWYGAANTNTFVLQDENSKVVAACKAETGKLTHYMSGLHVPVTKLTAETLDGGTLIVYV